MILTCGILLGGGTIYGDLRQDTAKDAGEDSCLFDSWSPNLPAASTATLIVEFLDFDGVDLSSVDPDLRIQALYAAERREEDGTHTVRLEEFRCSPSTSAPEMKYWCDAIASITRNCRFTNSPVFWSAWGMPVVVQIPGDASGKLDLRFVFFDLLITLTRRATHGSDTWIEVRFAQDSSPTAPILTGNLLLSTSDGSLRHIQLDLVNHARSETLPWTAINVHCYVTPRCIPDCMQPANTRTLWSDYSDQLLSRTLQLVDERVAIYSDSCDEALRANRWIAGEVRAFRELYGCEPAPGIAIIMETSPEVAGSTESKLRQMRSALPDGARELGSNDKVREPPRPYLLDVDAPYWESFCVEAELAQEVLGLNGSKNVAAWYCFLNTDEFHGEAVNRRVQQIENGTTAEMSFEERFSTYGLMVRGVLPFFWSEHKRIDLELMNLQRREALWTAMLNSCDLAAEVKTAALKKLEQETTARWRELLNSRPIE